MKSKQFFKKARYLLLSTIAISIIIWIGGRSNQTINANTFSSEGTEEEQVIITAETNEKIEDSSNQQVSPAN